MLNYFIISLEFFIIFLELSSNINLLLYKTIKEYSLEYYFDYFNLLSKAKEIKDNHNNLILIICIFYVSFLLFIILANFIILKSKNFNLCKNFSWKFIDITFHIFSIFVICFFTNEIIKCFYKNKIWNVVFYFTPLIIFIIFNYVYAYVFNVQFFVNKKLTSKYDSKFSWKYDIIIIIIKILIGINFTLRNHNKEDHIIYFSILIIAIAFFFSLYIFILIITNNNLFFINKNYNILRIFLINFLSAYFFLNSLFQEISKQTFYYALFIMILSLCLIFYVYYLSQKIEQNIFNSSKIKQIFYLLYKNFNSNCTNKNGKILFSLIATSNLKTYKNEDFVNLLQLEYKTLKNELKNFVCIFSQEDLLFFKILKLYFLELKYRENKILLNFKLHKLLKNYVGKNRQTNIFYNIKLFSTNVNKNFSLVLNNENYKLIKILIDTQNSLSNVIEEMLNVIYKIKIHSDNITQFLINFYKKKIEIASNLKLLNDSKFSLNDHYSLIILNYVNMELFNKKNSKLFLKNNFDEYEELLEHVFTQSKIIEISVNTINHTILISKISGELAYIQGKEFGYLIPKKIKNAVILEFIKQLLPKLSSNIFKFETLIKTNSKYMNLCIQCKRYESEDRDEIILKGEYESFSNIIMFKNTNLTFLSKNMEHILFFNQELLKRLLQLKKHIKFNKLFLKNIKESNEQANTFTINYYKIQKTITKYLDLFSEVCNKNDLLGNINRLNFFISKYKKIEIELILNYSFALDGDKYDVYFYRFLNLNKKISDKFLLKSSFDVNEGINNIFNVNHDTSSSIQISKKEDKYSRFEKNKINLLKQNEKRKERKLSNFTIFLTYFNIFLIIFTIASILIGLLQNYRVKSLYLLNNDLHTFKEFYYHTVLNFYQNILAYKFNSTDISNYNQADFFSKFKKNNPKIKIDVAQYSYLELISKLDILDTYIINFTNNVYKSSYYNYISPFLDKKFDNNFLSVEGENITLQKNYLTLLDNIDNFVNKVSIIVKSNEVFLYLYFFSYNNLDQPDFSKIYNKNLTPNQIYTYEILLNYELIYKNLENLGNYVENLYEGELNYIKKINLYFF